jgi:Ca2+-binding RTX toxin-like protein
MRKIATIITALVLMLALSTGAAFASQAINYGTSAGEVIKGTARANVTHGLGGNDAIHGLGGNDLLYGDAGHDGLYGGSGDDTVRGGDGDDRAEERKVFGGSGDDALYGGPGNDTLHSMGDGGSDYVDCGAGTDTVKKGSGQSLDRFVGCERLVN